MAETVINDSSQGGEGSIFLSESESSILNACSQTHLVNFRSLFESIDKVKKLGEGIFGEVYQGIRTKPINKTKSIVSGGDCAGGDTEQSFTPPIRVFKIVPVEGTEDVNGEKQMKYEQLLHEISVSKKVTELKLNENGAFYTNGFIKLEDAHVVYGRYPESLIQAWIEWNRDDRSDNECPNFSDTQKFVVIEYEYGGTDGSHFLYENAQQALFAVLQVAYTLAVAESAFQFEHRDLHGHNFLVERTPDEWVTFTINGKSTRLPTHGLKVRVIDFTWARFTDQNGNPVYLDMASDEEMFVGSNDHQFNIYRMMREINCDNWKDFHPKTNIFWIHFIAEKLERKRKFFSNLKNFKINKDMQSRYMRQLKFLKNQLLDFATASEFVESELCELYQSQSIFHNRER